MPETSKQYEAALDAYYDAQRAFRETAVAEISRLMPEGVARVVLEINDTPRFTVIRMEDARGDDVLEDHEDVWAVLDQIATDMEVFTWDEADSFLFHDDADRDLFIITKEGPADA